jgi:hypothetical protein
MWPLTPTVELLVATLACLIACLIVACMCTTTKRVKEKNRALDGASTGVILMYCTQNIMDDWAKYSVAINRKYAQRHNYDFAIVTEPYDPTVTHAWQKIPAILALLERNYDFVVYMDADAVVNMQEVAYEHFLLKYTGDIIVCSDEANSDGFYAVNGGMVIVRNTSDAKTLLHQWWGLRYDYPEFAFEQWALSDIVRNKHPEINGRIVSVAPETDFNSIYGEIFDYIENMDTKPRPERFVLHFMAIDHARRREILSRLHAEL